MHLHQLLSTTILQLPIMSHTNFQYTNTYFYLIIVRIILQHNIYKFNLFQYIAMNFILFLFHM